MAIMLLMLLAAVCFLGAAVAHNRTRDRRAVGSGREADGKRHLGQAIYELNRLFASAAADMNTVARREWHEWR
jgi:hypothetical protein